MNIDAHCVGLSQDGRTNVWRVRCQCGLEFKPTTTMLRYQSFSCPRCDLELCADWAVPKVEVAA